MYVNITGVRRNDRRPNSGHVKKEFPYRNSRFILDSSKGNGIDDFMIKDMLTAVLQLVA
jgi:hypothetical protein